ncbi:MAG: hypothetical protein A3H96_17815 [Acidobacteria bacterium RIFCSPLOWO2_02_FULL_67_36]|nr:MAG: hypothetical protein A3H96_17815 [Acidobacteria bacterium RIFCSPLOWO2_02_FULL_67_36]
MRSVRSLPASVAGVFDEITACHLSPEGDYLVFDRRAHSVYTVPRGGGAPRKIVQIGGEPGRILQPSAFDSAVNNGTFVVADIPSGRARIQFFFYMGQSVGGFFLAGRPGPQVTIGVLVLGGIASIEYTGRSILLNQPESGTLVTEYGTDGHVIRTFGNVRATGQERDRAVHLALNAGIPIVNPAGGYYFLFVSGVPLFRKYDAAGKLVFERHVEGTEMDDYVRSVPTVWPKRPEGGQEMPLVSPAIRTAAADPDGNLWISLTAPFTYVYDAAGNKRRTIRFTAAGTLMPTNFFFTADRRVLVAPGCYQFAR